MNIRPLKDRVVVKRLESENRSLGGIIIPDSAKEKPFEGIVIAVGAGKVSDEGKLIVPDIKVGARVLFGKYAGNEIEIDGESHIIMKEDDILGILN